MVFNYAVERAPSYLVKVSPLSLDIRSGDLPLPPDPRLLLPELSLGLFDLIEAPLPFDLFVSYGLNSKRLALKNEPVLVKAKA
jgi:hypothetical protein